MNWKFSKGFSLIELVLIVAIAGMIILVVANIPNAIKLIGTSEKESIAREIAAKKVEDIRSTGYDGLSNNIPNGIAISDSRLSKLFQGSGTILIEDCPVDICTQGESAKKVTIRISWKESGNPKSFEVVTLVVKGGLR